jgi:hypothetical protein
MRSWLFRSGATPEPNAVSFKLSVDADFPVVIQLEMSRVIVHRSEWVHTSQSKNKTQAEEASGSVVQEAQWSGLVVHLVLVRRCRPSRVIRYQ